MPRTLWEWIELCAYAGAIGLLLGGLWTLGVFLGIAGLTVGRLAPR